MVYEDGDSEDMPRAEVALHAQRTSEAAATAHADAALTAAAAEGVLAGMMIDCNGRIKDSHGVVATVAGLAPRAGCSVDPSGNIVDLFGKVLSRFGVSAGPSSGGAEISGKRKRSAPERLPEVSSAEYSKVLRDDRKQTSFQGP